MEISSRNRKGHHGNKPMRGNPEGDSIIHKKKYRPSASSHQDLSGDSGVSSMKRRKQHGYDDYHGQAKKSHGGYRRTFSDSDLSALDITDTPDSLSQISAIAPVSDISLAQTTFSRMKPREFKADTTWENAVSHARGEPDGAEKSFAKKRSKVSMKEVLATVPEDESLHSKGSGGNSIQEQENIPQEHNQPEATGDKKSTIKGHLKKAASVLKKARSKSKLPESKVGVKRKLDSTLADETMTKKPPMKELTKKERKTVRKTMKSNYEQIQRSKKIWEELRRKNVTDVNKLELCNELLSMVRGKMKEFCFAHDTARVIQCLIQHGSEQQRDLVFDELKEEIITMSKSKYAKFLVKKLLMYGSKQHRSCIYKSFHGHVRRLIRHKEGSEVIEYSYNEYATGPQRLMLLEDFYGPSFALFKTPDIKCLGQIMLSQPDKREMILRNMREALLPLIDKEILNHTIVHKVFMEYFTYADGKLRTEMIEALRDSLLSIIHTRDGARVVMHCIWHGTAKDRKSIIKTLKGSVVKICKEEYGHLVLLAIFDSVDDTKIVRLALLDEMLKSLSDVAGNQYGRKVLMYLLCPRDPHHFHPDIVRVLQDGDQNAISKKEKAVRYRELLEAVSPALLQYIVDNVKVLVTNNTMLLLLITIISHADGDPILAMEAVAKMASEPNTDGALHIVESPTGHMTLKRLIQNDKERLKQGQKVLFSDVLLKAIPEGAIKSWAASNRGCFTLTFLLELEHPPISQTVVGQLKPVRSSLKKMIFKGAQVLLQKLDDAKNMT